MNPISTGYKPEWGLGAVYQGINAADSEALNQEELIRSFLANQRESQMQPLDIGIKQFEAAKANAQNTPELLQRFVEAERAKMDKTVGEEELRAARQPHEMQKIPMFAKKEQAQLLQDANLLELQKTLASQVDREGNPISPQDMQILNQELQRQVAMRGQTPELFGRMEQEKLKGQLDIDKANVAGEWALKVAQARQSGGAGGGVDKLYKTWMAAKPDVRIGPTAAGLQAGINPITREPMTETERIFFMEQLRKDQDAFDMQARNVGGGMTLKDGKIVDAPTKSIKDGGTSQNMTLQEAIAAELKRRQEKGK